MKHYDKMKKYKKNKTCEYQFNKVNVFLHQQK